MGRRVATVLVAVALTACGSHGHSTGPSVPTACQKALVAYSQTSLATTQKASDALMRISLERCTKAEWLSGAAAIDATNPSAPFAVPPISLLNNFGLDCDVNGGGVGTSASVTACR